MPPRAYLALRNPSVHSHFLFTSRVPMQVVVVVAAAAAVSVCRMYFFSFCCPPVSVLRSSMFLFWMCVVVDSMVFLCRSHCWLQYDGWDASSGACSTASCSTFIETGLFTARRQVGTSQYTQISRKGEAVSAIHMTSLSSTCLSVFLVASLSSD